MRISADLGHTKGNENVKKNLSGGGVFLLTLSVVLGVCLVTLPVKAAENDNNNANVVSAATEVVNGNTYQIYDINAQTTWSQVQSYVSGTTYVKLRLQEDCGANWSGVAQLFGNYLIIDLNGHTWKPSGFTGIEFYIAHLVQVEDSSGGQGVFTYPISLMNRTTDSTVVWHGGKCSSLIIWVASTSAVTTLQVDGGEIGSVVIRNNSGAAVPNALKTQFASHVMYTPNRNPDYAASSFYLFTNIVAAASQEVIDGLTYEIMYIYADTSWSSLTSFVNRTVNAKLRVQEDCGANWSGVAQFFARNLIIDLNGYTWNGIRFGGIEFHTDYLIKIEDSSGGLGVMKNPIFAMRWTGSNSPTVVVNGGQVDNVTMYVGRGASSFLMHGGKVGTLVFQEIGSVQPVLSVDGGTIKYVQIRNATADFSINATFAPQVMYTTFHDINYTVDNLFINICVPDYITLSTSSVVTGVYNHAFALVSEVSGNQLPQITIPSDQVYYLYGRTQGTEYQRYGAYFNGVFQREILYA